MKLNSALIMLALTFVACQIESHTQDQQISSRESTSEAFYPKTHEVVTKVDTLLSQVGISVHITQYTLESYVTNEYETGDGQKQIDKYRDFSYVITVKNEEENLFETTIIKEDFQEYTGTEFLTIARLYYYEFDRLSDEGIIFFGSIGVPETDEVVPFYHILNLDDQSFSFEALDG